MSAPPRGTVRVPHVYTLIFTLIVLTALASLVVTPGSYERDERGRVVPDSFRHDAPGARLQPPAWELPLLVLRAPLAGLADAGEIVAFLLVVGGAFKVIDRSGAFNALVAWLVGALRSRGILLVPGSMILFSIGGAVFGMSEEVIPFVILFVPLMRALGYQPIVGVAVPLVGAAMGFAGAMLNPFTVGVAQSIAGLPPVSGWEVRTAIWCVLTALGIAYVMRTARRYRLDEKSRHMIDEERAAQEHALTARHVGVLLALLVGIVVMVWGIGAFEWYVIEIGAVFLAIGLVAALIAGIRATDAANAFTEGARDLLSAAIVIGMARGIVLLAADLRLLDPMLSAAAGGLSQLHGVVSINAMFVFQSLLNFLVPSGSGQAALTMPIMAPLADLIGLTRQQAVLAFQFGDGFTNLITPTSAVLMGSIEAGKCRYEQWFRFAWPLQIWLVAAGAVLLSLTVVFGYGVG